MATLITLSVLFFSILSGLLQPAVSTCLRKSENLPNITALRQFIPQFAVPEFRSLQGLVFEVTPRLWGLEIDVFLKKSEDSCVTAEKIKITRTNTSEDQTSFHFLSGPGICRASMPVDRFKVSMVYMSHNQRYLFVRTCNGQGNKLILVLVDCHYRLKFRDKTWLPDTMWKNEADEYTISNDTVEDMIVMAWNKHIYGKFFEDRWTQLHIANGRNLCKALKDSGQDSGQDTTQAKAHFIILGLQWGVVPILLLSLLVGYFMCVRTSSRVYPIHN